MATKVLVADDEEQILQSTRALLEMLGFEVVITTDPEQVPELARRERPSVLLQDVRMPGLDLERLVRTLREDGLQIKIVLFSAAMDLDRVASDLSVDAFVEKPFRPEELAAAVA